MYVTLNKRMVLMTPLREQMIQDLQHVLPKGFTKIRYYGLLHHTHKTLFTIVQKKLEQNHNGEKNQKETHETTPQPKGNALVRPHCKKGNPLIIESISRKQRAPP